MSMSLAFSINQIWIFALLAITSLNFFRRREELLKSSVFVLLVYALTQVINANWVITLPASDAVKVHYLFFTIVPIVTAAGLFFFNRQQPTFLLLIAITLLLLEAFSTFTVFIDRNILALNENTAPNLYAHNQWFLWDFRNYFATTNNLIVLAAVMLPKSFKINIKTSAEAEDLLEDIEAHAHRLPDSSNKQAALDYTEAANILLYDYDQDGQVKNLTQPGITLLQKAVSLSRYEPAKVNLGDRSTLVRFVYWLRS